MVIIRPDAVPTIPLYNTAAAPDGWHDVRAPGGFEAWFFDGAEGGGNRRIMAGLFDGYPFHSRYQRLTERYLARPTRCAPPSPRDFPCMAIWIQRAGDHWDELAFEHPPGSLIGKPDRLDVTLGQNAVKRAAPGGISMRLLYRDSPIDILVELSGSEANVVLSGLDSLDCQFKCAGTFKHIVRSEPHLIIQKVFEEFPSGPRRQRIMAGSLARMRDSAARA